MPLSRHIFLCGFMASGKSTVGPRLARALSVPFRDTDAMLEERASMSIPSLYALKGEAFFREMEHSLLLELPALSPCVIATGGGLPVYPPNVPLLRAAGTVIFLDRDWKSIWLSLSQRRGRPMSSGKSQAEMLALYEKRLPLYRACAELTVPNNGTPAACVRRILSILCLDQAPA